jgi:heterodisulfide reductase subunit A
VEILRHGVTILATGAVEAGGQRYALGAHPKVVRQSALEELIAHQPERAAGLRSVVMIQCVEAEGAVEYCSRICCTNTIKNALRLKLLNPDCQVIILYKNIITYGFREKYYLEARRRGVLFVRYTEEQPPQVWVEAGGVLRCR